MSVQADTSSFQVHCQFKSGDNSIADTCSVTQIYDDTHQWTQTQISWDDGRLTHIQVETINRRMGDRVDSRYGLATVDGQNAEYRTFSDGGICFVIERNQDYLCYR